MKNLNIITLFLLTTIGFFTLSGFNNKEKTNEPHFIEVTVSNYIILHGFDASNKEIEEYVKDQLQKKKLISVDRIQSVSGKYICTTYTNNRLIFWEYNDGYENLKRN